jgi:hypothetical protein
MRNRRSVPRRIAAAAVTAMLLLHVSSAAVSRDTLPAALSDREFWLLIEQISEPDGFFRSNSGSPDNLLSNETNVASVAGALAARVKASGVYLGVGPEQNFTYILAFEPKISFIVDIRRLNMLEHLLYKATFELSADRAEFMSRLFSRSRPDELHETSSADALFDAYEHIRADATLFERNFEQVRIHLTKAHGFVLSQEDLQQIRHVLTAFFDAGPDLSYTFLSSYYQGTLGMPTYRELLTNDGQKNNWSFLSTEDRFRRIQAIQRKNLIIPLVGDFAGPKTLRSVANYMARHNALLRVFYTSNVEMYLFQQADDWKLFYENVSALPINSASSFIRFAAGRRRRGDSGSAYFSMRSQMWSPVREVLEAVRDGEVDDYPGVLGRSE